MLNYNKQTVYSQTRTEQELNKLTKLVKSGQLSDSLACNIHKLVGLEINQLEIDLTATEKDLSEFEQQYNMSTVDFLRKWQAGEIDDSMDNVEWASLAQMAENLRERGWSF